MYKVLVVTAVTVVTEVRKIAHPLKKNPFGKSNLIHLTTNVMFSGQRFAILAMFMIESTFFNH